MRRSRVAALVVSALGLASSAARADEPRDERPKSPRLEPRFTPTVGVMVSGLSERASLAVEGMRVNETRTDLRVGPSVGLAHPVFALTRESRLDGHATVGVAPTVGGGRWHLPLREDVTFAWDAQSWLTLRAGLGAGIVFDATRAAMSFGEIAIPMSITFVRSVEVAYRPSLAFALGEEERAVFGGALELSAGTAVIPLDFALRFRIRALGF